MKELIGAIHIHSEYSDGSGTVEDIVKFASEVGLDYIVLTDHNTLRPLKEGKEGWYNNTLLLIGCEINDKNNQNHYLALGIKENISTRIPATEYVKEVNKQGGIGFIAHPHEKRDSMKEHPPYPWTAWNSTDFIGIEIWNHMSEWMEGLTEENKYTRFMHPLKSIKKPQEETLRVWDNLSMQRKVIGIGGIDAHAHKLNFLGFFEVEVFPYKVLFKSIRTHLLITDNDFQKKENLEECKKALYNSLKQGNCFFSNFYHGNAKGFKFWAENSKGQTFIMGEELLDEENIFLKVELPEEAEIRIIYNGKLFGKEKKQKEIFKHAGKGIYRVEVYKNNNAWIYSNHIRII